MSPKGMKTGKGLVLVCQRAHATSQDWLVSARLASVIDGQDLLTQLDDATR